MRIVTNPGSNVPEEARQHYAIDLCPQQIVVDGISHDTRTGIEFSCLDRWVEEAAEFPHVVGTTAHEFVAMFSAIAREDPEIVVVLTSKQIIQTHAAAVSAARTLEASTAFKHVQLAVVDSRTTDVGAGLLVIAAGEARRANLSLRTTRRVLETLAQRGLFAFVPGTLHNLVKGGRAGWLRAHLAGLLNLRPMIGFRDGELKQLETVGGRTDAGAALVDHAVKALGRERPVWVAANHTDPSDERASTLLALAKASMNVTYGSVRASSASIYLHAGPGALGLAAYPVDDLPWELPTPPSFAS